MVTIRKDPESGRWVWIEDHEGQCWCEVDCGFDINEVPSHLHASVKSAYEWALAENARMAEEESESRAGENEVADWQHEYYNTRGIL